MAHRERRAALIDDVGVHRIIWDRETKEWRPVCREPGSSGLVGRRYADDVTPDCELCLDTIEPAAEPAAEAPPDDVLVDWESMTKRDLVEIASGLGMTGVSRATKAELVEMLRDR